MKIKHEVREGQLVPVSMEIEDEKEVEFLLKQIRPKGKWVYEKDTVNSVFRCSNCGRFYPYDTFVKEDDDRYTRLEREDANRFCWHCGADMRGD